MDKKIVLVIADDSRFDDLLSREISSEYTLQSIDGTRIPEDLSAVAAVFILKAEYAGLLSQIHLSQSIPVFIHSVNQTLSQHGEYCLVRINAWPGFLRNNLLEISCGNAEIVPAEKFLTDIGWAFKWVKDQPGMVTPRVIAMLINEACYAVEENVATKEAIDTAMKLGTNYPFGPFEWAKLIGPENIYSLLEVLSVHDPRYIPAINMPQILSATL